MTNRFVFLLVAGLFLSAAAADAQVPADPEAKQKLVGTWTIKIVDDEIILTGEEQLRPDGTFTLTADISMFGKKEQRGWEGTWDVKEGVIVEKITSSTRSGYPDVGHETRDKLLEITDRTYRTRTRDGSIEEYSRK